MEKYITYVKDNKVTIQQHQYIDDGWYIEIEDGIITLIEIPLGGGEEQIVDHYDTLIEAINAGKTLT